MPFYLVGLKLNAWREVDEPMAVANDYAWSQVVSKRNEFQEIL